MPFAFLDINPDSVVRTVTNALAVGGAFLAGHVCTGFAAWALDRWAFGGKAPDGLKRVLRILGGLALAILVALLLFRGGGSGTGGTGPGGGPTDSPGDGKGGTPTQPTERTPPTPPAVTPADPTEPRERVRVTVLAGDAVKEGRFFRIGDDPAAKTLDELAAEADRRRLTTGKRVELIVSYPPDGVSGPDTNGAAFLTRWANANGVVVVQPDRK